MSPTTAGTPTEAILRGVIAFFVDVALALALAGESDVVIL
jgi:hypothetical protein